MEHVTQKNASLIQAGFCYGNVEHAHYEKQGYCLFKTFLTPEGLAACLANVERMIERIPQGHTPEELYSPHVLGERWLWELATEEKVLDMVEKQVGPNIVLWSTHLLCKPPLTGIDVPWHQDAPYWNITGKLAPAVWIPLDDIDDDNGAMSVLPGWHTKGVLKRRVDEGRLFFDEIDPDVLPADLDERKVPYHLQAGQMALHDTMIPHNSVPNRSNRWRRVMILRYMDAAGKAGEKLLKDYRTGKDFSRVGYLVRGADVMNRGWKQSPF